MILPVRAKSERQFVECEFAAQFDLGILNSWKSELGGDGSNEQSDAVEYCESALAKFIFYRQKNRVAVSEVDLITRAQREPMGETLGILAVTAPWWLAGQWLGFCAFRRTWSNNIVFDYLATHPRLLVGNPRPVSGVGTAMPWRLSLVARVLRANRIWAETTSTSVNYYTAVFNLGKLADLFVLDAEEFYERLREKMG